MSFSLLNAWNVKLDKNSVNAFFEISLSPPKCKFNAAIACTDTNAFAFVALNIWYGSIGDNGISVLIKREYHFAVTKLNFGSLEIVPYYNKN